MYIYLYIHLPMLHKTYVYLTYIKSMNYGLTNLNCLHIPPISGVHRGGSSPLAPPPGKYKIKRKQI